MAFDRSVPDPDAPIPYSLTARGHMDVAELRMEEAQRDCDHGLRSHVDKSRRIHPVFAV
jgi:hypothetical protein